MKILAIRGANIASLKEFDLDFTQEPLRDSGIFAITGPTGSGKSSMLDALCLALYHEVPRLQESSGSNTRFQSSAGDITLRDPRHIIRRGSDTGFAEVDFQARDGHSYRARWGIRAPKRSGASPQDEYAVYRLSQNTAGDTAQTKLSKKAFSENDLSDKELLENSKSKCLSLTETLTGLNFQQFSRTVLLAQGQFSGFLRTGDVQERARILEQLTGTQWYSEIGKRIFQERKVRSEKYALISQGLDQLEILSSENHQRIQKELELKTSQQQNLRAYIKDMENFSAQLKKTQECSTEHQEKQLQLQNQTITLKKLQNDQEPELRKLADLKNRAEIEIPVLEKAIHLDQELHFKQQSQNSLKQELETIAQELQKRQDTVKKAELKKNQIDEQCQHSWNHFIKPYTTKYEPFTHSIAEMCTSQEALRDLTDQCRSHKNLVRLDHEKIRLEEKLQSFAPELSLIASSLKAKTPKLDQKKTELHKWSQVQNKTAEALRATLQDGEECPVCGSTEHPFSQHGALEPLKQELEQLQSAITSLEQELAELNSKKIRYFTQQDDTKEALKKIKHDLQEQQKHIHIPLLNQIQSTEQLDVLIAWAQHQENTLQFTQRINQITEEIQSWNSLQIEKQRSLDDLHARITELTEQRKTLNLGPAPEKEKKQIQNDLQQQQKTVEQSQKDLQTLQNSLSLLQGATDQLAIQKQHHETLLAELQITLSTYKKTFSCTQGDQANDEANDVANVETLYQQSGSMQQALKNLQVSNSELENRLRELGFQLETDAQNRKKRQEIEKTLKNLQADLQEWEQICDLAGDSSGKTFQMIAQQYTLDLLLNIANQKLRDISERYQLKKHGDSMHFVIVDHDNYDSERPVHTLSGGETFVVSLALALALSELASGNQALETLFIDEGFGSLDSGTLRQVMKALSSLHAQGRQIGVITHVEEMKNNIPVQIQVKRTAPGLSQVSVLG